MIQMQWRKHINSSGRMKDNPPIIPELSAAYWVHKLVPYSSSSLGEFKYLTQMFTILLHYAVEGIRGAVLSSFQSSDGEGLF